MLIEHTPVYDRHRTEKGVEWRGTWRSARRPGDGDLAGGARRIGRSGTALDLRRLSAEPDFHPALRVVRPAGVKEATASRPTSPCSAPPGYWSRPTGARARFNRLRREEFDARFPGLLALVLAEAQV